MSDAPPAPIAPVVPPPAPVIPPAPPAPAPVAQPPEPETFSKEYVRELRAENKGWRLKAQEQEAAAQAAKTAADAARTEADGKISTASHEANARIIRAELKAHAIRAGMTDMDFLKLIDASAIKIGDDGEVKVPDDFFAKIKESKPHYFGAAPQSTSNPASPPSPTPPVNKKATEMSPEEVRVLEKSLNIRA